MSTERSADRSVDVDIDLAAERVEVRTVTTRSTTVEGLFQNGELRLWEDRFGWAGFELRDDGEFYEVNFVKDARYDPDAGERVGEYLDEVRVSREDVAEGIREHIRDEEAGGRGNFVRGCSPP